MAEEVKIRITEERSGNAIAEEMRAIRALNDEAAKKDRLNADPTFGNKLRAEAIARGKALVPQAQAAGDAQAASSIARQVREMDAAAKLHAKTGGSYDTALGMARQQIAAEDKITAAKKDQAAQHRSITAEHKAATREQREQHSLERAMTSRQSRLFNAVAGGAERMAGVGGMGGITGAAAGFGGMKTAGIAAIAALAYKAFEDRMLAGHDLKMEGMRDTEARGRDARHLKRLSGFEGSASAARNEAQDARDALADRQEEHKRLKEEQRVSTYKPLAFWQRMIGVRPEEDKAVSESSREQDRLRDKIPKAEEAKRKHWSRSGKLELDAQDMEIGGDRRGGRKLRDEKMWWAEYNRVKGELGEEGEAEAQRSAGSKLFLAQRERAGQFGKLVDARSGAGDIARLAGMAAAQMAGGNPRLLGGVGELTAAVKGNHAEAMQTAWREKFKPRMGLRS